MSFDFAQAFDQTTAYNPSGGLLRPGKHVVTIKEVDGSQESTNGYPKIVVDLENGSGHITDFLVVSPKEFAIAKVMGLLLSAGLPRPSGHDVDATSGRLTRQYLARLVGRKIGVVVIEEEDFKGELDERTGKVKVWPRVQGYVGPDQVDSDIPADTGGMRSTFNDPPAGAADDDLDLPF